MTASKYDETIASTPQQVRTPPIEPADAATASAASASTLTPERVGPYKLLQALGEGGFGTVYLAEQQKPVVRRVALKIIKLGMDTKQVIARFEAERQALAMMDHPNIAKVLDAGATDTGRPYFVMELVRGEPITDYCDRHQLLMPERLELFQDVCHAVQHAHQKGVIHRDIKPSNVMVTIGDGKPVPKVIDFGIAKATAQRLTDKTVYTEMRQFVGTPAYMSPEQAEMSGVDIDTRSDIYSLGVLLYELLTGTTPFDVETFKTVGLVDLQRMIREMEPPKPSTRILALGETALLIAARRKTDAMKLKRLIRGELDWIVMKSLEKDRTRRYDTANALALDVARYLNDEPVLAGPPSATYRFSKMVKRNKGVFAAGAAVAAALLVGLSAALYGFIAASRERDAKEVALVAEARQAAKAQAVSRFLQDMLGSANAENRSREETAKGRDVTIVQVLDAAVKKVEGGALAAEPLVEAAVRETIGNTYKGLGAYPAADPQLTEALELRKATLGSGHADVAASLSSLSILRSRQGQIEEAETLQREALAIRRATLGQESEEVAASLSELGAVVKARGKAGEAEALLRESLTMRRKLFGEKHLDIAQSLHSLAWLLQNEGRLAEAEILGREAVAMYKELGGEVYTQSVASGLDNLALVLKQQGKLAEAEPIYREVLAMDRQLLGNNHPDLANSLMNTATLLRDAGKLEAAEPMYKEALAIVRTALPPGHANTAACLSGYGSLLLDLQRADEAEPMLRECLAIRGTSLPKEDWRLAHVTSLLGAALAAQAKYSEAERLLLEGYESMQSSSGATPARRRQALERVVKLYESWNAAQPGPEAAAKLARWHARLENDVKPPP